MKQSNQRGALLVLALLHCASSSPGGAYPNPTAPRSGSGGGAPACGIVRRDVDRVCDPDSILQDSSATALQLQRILVTIERNGTTGVATCPGMPAKGPQVAFALMRRLPTTGSRDRSSNKAAAARKAATELHDAWGVGRAGCNDGLLFLLALEDKQVHLSTGSGVKEVFTDVHVSVLIDRMKPRMRAGEVDAALLGAAHDIAAVFLSGDTGGVVLGPGHAQRAASFLEAVQSASGWSGPLEALLEWAIIAVMGGGFVTALLLQMRRRHKRQAGWEEARARLLEMERLREACLSSGSNLAPTPSTAASAGAQGSPEDDAAHTYDEGGAPLREDSRDSDGGLLTAASAAATGYGSDTHGGSEQLLFAGDAESDTIGGRSVGGGGGVARQRQRRRNGSPTPLLHHGAPDPSAAAPAPLRRAVPEHRPPTAALPLAARMSVCPICLEDFSEAAAPPAAAEEPSSKDRRRGDAPGSPAAPTPPAADHPVSRQGAAAPQRNRVISLPCHHRFHLACADAWMGAQGKNTCPVCRAAVYDAPDPRDVEAAGAGATGGGGGPGGPQRPRHYPPPPGAADAYSSSSSSHAGGRYGGGAAMFGGGAGGYDHTLDLIFLMHAMRRRYPTYVTPEFAAAVERDPLAAPMARAPAFTGVEPARLEAMAAHGAAAAPGSGGWAGGGFGGGSSFGGSGGGGSW